MLLLLMRASHSRFSDCSNDDLLKICVISVQQCSVKWHLGGVSGEDAFAGDGAPVALAVDLQPLRNTGELTRSQRAVVGLKDKIKCLIVAANALITQLLQHSALFLRQDKEVWH